MARSVFISLNHRDSGLAEALEKALNSIFGEALKVQFSTKSGAIPSGSNWYQWIVQQVIECDVAFVMITPNSVQAPWLMWESGAVFGAAIASSEEADDKVWPIVYQLKTDEIPSPIRDSNTQRRYGDRIDEIKALILDLHDRYRADWQDSWRKLPELDKIVDNYIKEVHEVLLNAPAVPDATVLEEWRMRVREIEKKGRSSEVRQLQQWMEVAFGQDPEGPQPVDLSIHVHLGELYAGNGDYESAIQQYNLARRMASRDIFILRRLGRFYLEIKNMKGAEEVIERIDELDKTAYKTNAECAALKGRFYIAANDLPKAVDSYTAALPANPQSYYLANLAAETYLKLNDTANANNYFEQAVRIIDNDIIDRNHWTAATKANAYVALGQLDKAEEEVDIIAAFKPGRDALDSILRGLRGIADKLDPKPEIQPLINKLS